VAARADTLEQFGMNVRDWIHELRHMTCRDGLLAAVSHRLPMLRDSFPGEEIADAFLAAQVEHLGRHAGSRPPRWTASSEYVLDEPWFGYSDPSSGLWAILIRDAGAKPWSHLEPKGPKFRGCGSSAPSGQHLFLRFSNERSPTRISGLPTRLKRREGFPERTSAA